MVCLLSLAWMLVRTNCGHDSRLLLLVRAHALLSDQQDHRAHGQQTAQGVEDGGTDTAGLGEGSTGLVRTLDQTETGAGYKDLAVTLDGVATENVNNNEGKLPVTIVNQSAVKASLGVL